MSTIRVATYNLYLGADISVVFDVSSPEELGRKARLVFDEIVGTDFPARAAAIARILVTEEVDVVGLQEVVRWSRVAPEAGDDGGTEVWLDFLDELLEALAAEGVGYDVHARTANFSGGARVAGGESMRVLGHNVVLVRRGRGVHVVAERTGAFSRSLHVPTGMPDLVLDVARSWGWVVAEADGRPFRFVNVHTEAWDDDVRDAQRDELFAQIGEPGSPVVVVGDLNATPDRVGRPEEYVDAWEVAGEGGRGFTSGQAADLRGEDALDARIDYVWAKGVAVRRCWVVGARAQDRTPSGLWPSDHAGVVAEIEL